MSQQTASEMNAREFSRWIWRQLTSMRTALMLLLLLAIVSVPGSVVPQRGVDARAVEQYFIDNPTRAEILDKLGMFSVYSSPWFSAVYLLLMVSLIGCIVPRTLVYLRALRSRPPKTPRNLMRIPASATFETDATPHEVMAAGRKVLKFHRIDTTEGDDEADLRAEKGYLREAGNLLFHVSIVFVLIGVAAGSLFGYRGSVIVTEGDGFSYALSQYDDFASGPLFNADDMQVFELRLDDMIATFQPFGTLQAGSPKDFRAKGRYSVGTDGEEKTFDIKVNHPLSVGNAAVHLLGQGYAPILKVTDAEGNVVLDDAVPFLPTDSTYTSNGVLKLPDAEPEQLGFQGFFLPTAAMGDDGVSISIHPAAANPMVSFNVWSGDLGLDDGRPQSVYVLDKSKLTQFKDDDGKNLRITLSPGQVADLPGGGSIEYVATAQFARFQISQTPLVWLPLAGIVGGLIGLIFSLFIQSRRTWVRARREGSRTVVEVATLERSPRDELPADLEEFTKRLRAALDDPKETT